jgi:hypothetical protein
MVLTVTALQQESVMKSITVAVFALLAGALMLSNQEALARNCCDDGFGNTATYSISRIRTKD